MEIRALIPSFLKAREMALSWITMDKDRKALNRFLEYMEEENIREVEALSKEVVQDYQEYVTWKTISQGPKQGRVITPAYRNQLLISLAHFLRWMKKEDYLAADLAVEIHYAKRARRLPRNILTVQEVEKLLEAPDTNSSKGLRDRLIMELLYGTGLRSKEMRQIKVSDVDLGSQALYIREGKGNKDRVVPLGEGLCQLIRDYLEKVRSQFQTGKDFQKNESLFLGGEKGHISKTALGRLVEFYGKQAEIKKPATPHALRHACATHMMANGAPIRHVQELLGHAQLNTTQLYTQVTITDLKKAHAKYHPREKMEQNKDEKEH